MHFPHMRILTFLERLGELQLYQFLILIEFALVLVVTFTIAFFEWDMVLIGRKMAAVVDGGECVALIPATE